MATRKLIMSVFVLAKLTVVGEAITDANAGITTNTIGNCAAPSPDLDSDGKVGFSDFLIFAGVFNSREGDGNYEPRYDLNSNGSIEFSDFLIFAESFGKQSWSEVISLDKVTLPPPTWIFAGDVPAADRRALREEMEYVRAYFADRFGVEATGFTVLVGIDYEALAVKYGDIVGRDLKYHYQPHANYTYAWVTTTPKGSAVMALVYGTLNDNSRSSLKHHVAHEYFHVLQGQIASGFAQLDVGEIAWHSSGTVGGPKWLVEGLASYADYAYTPFRAGRSPFLGGRYTPYGDISWFRDQVELGTMPSLAVGEGDLARIEDSSTFKCSFSEFYSYALSFAASVFLVSQASEESYVRYWELLGERPSWQAAFEEAFCVGIDDFYKAFDDWLPGQLPNRVQLSMQLVWPDINVQPQSWKFLYLDIENWGVWDQSRPSGMTTGRTGFGRLPLYLTFRYEGGAIGRGFLSLWWSDDQCTEYLLGWYNNGELTRKREEATSVEFTGISSRIEWTLPAHPDTLPRLKERKRTHCQ